MKEEEEEEEVYYELRNPEEIKQLIRKMDITEYITCKKCHKIHTPLHPGDFMSLLQMKIQFNKEDIEMYTKLLEHLHKKFPTTKTQHIRRMKPQDLK